MTVYIKVEGELDDYRLNEAWQVYSGALTRLDTIAVQAQTMSRAAFDEMMGDPEFDKIELLDPDGNMVGLSTMTTNLAKIPLVSAALFQEKYPEASADGKIMYVPFVAVPDSVQGAFTALIEHVFRQAVAVEGIVSFDACDYNVFQIGFFRAIETWTIKLSAGECSADYLGAQHHIAVDPAGAYGPKKRRLPAGMGARQLRSATAKKEQQS